MYVVFTMRRNKFAGVIFPKNPFFHLKQSFENLAGVKYPRASGRLVFLVNAFSRD